MKLRPSSGATRRTLKNSEVTRCPRASAGSPPSLRILQRRVADRRERLEGLLLRLPVQERLRRRRSAAERGGALRVVLEDRDDPVVLVEGQRAKDDGVHDREDRRSGANAQGEHDQRRRGRRRRAAPGSSRGSTSRPGAPPAERLGTCRHRRRPAASRTPGTCGSAACSPGPSVPQSVVRVLFHGRAAGSCPDRRPGPAAAGGVSASACAAAHPRCRARRRPVHSAPCRSGGGGRRWPSATSAPRGPAAGLRLDPDERRRPARRPRLAAVDAEATRCRPSRGRALPSHRRDGPRDALIHPYWAARGYACVRLDLRGSGESDGLLADEYDPLEQDDLLEVIAWLTAGLVHR